MTSEIDQSFVDLMDYLAKVRVSPQLKDLEELRGSKQVQMACEIIDSMIIGCWACDDYNDTWEVSFPTTKLIVEEVIASIPNLSHFLSTERSQLGFRKEIEECDRMAIAEYARPGIKRPFIW